MARTAIDTYTTYYKTLRGKDESSTSGDLLQFLATEPTISLAELQQRSHLSDTGLADAVRTLETLDFVQVVRDTSDRELVSLTPSGHSFLQHAAG